MASDLERVESPRLYSVEEAAQLLAIKPGSLRKWIASGAVRATKLGRRVTLTARELARISEEGLPSINGV